VLELQSYRQADFYFGDGPTVISLNLLDDEIVIAAEIFRNPVNAADFFKQIVLTDKDSIFSIPENLIDNIFWCSSKYIKRPDLGYAIQFRLSEIRSLLFEQFDKKILKSFLLNVGFRSFANYISLDFSVNGVFKNFYIPSPNLNSNTSKFLNFNLNDSLKVQLSSDFFSSDKFNSIYTNLLLNEGDYKILFGEGYWNENKEEIERRVEQIPLM